MPIDIITCRGYASSLQKLCFQTQKHCLCMRKHSFCIWLLSNQPTSGIETGNDSAADVMPNAEDGTRDGGHRIGGEMECGKAGGES